MYYVRYEEFLSYRFIACVYTIIIKIYQLLSKYIKPMRDTIENVTMATTPTTITGIGIPFACVCILYTCIAVCTKRVKLVWYKNARRKKNIVWLYWLDEKFNGHLFRMECSVCILLCLHFFFRIRRHCRRRRGCRRYVPQFLHDNAFPNEIIWLRSITVFAPLGNVNFKI